MDHRQILEKAAGHTPILRVGPPISRSFRSTPRNCHSTPQFDRSLDIASVIFTRMLSFRVFATHHPGLARTTHAHRPLTPRPHFTPLPNSFACHTSEKSPSKPFHCHTSKIIGLKVLCLPHIREKGVSPLFPLPAAASWFYLLYLPRSRCAPRAHACPLLRNNSFACHTCAFHGGIGVV
jgi:hypothetical protein